MASTDHVPLDSSDLLSTGNDQFTYNDNLANGQSAYGSGWPVDASLQYNNPYAAANFAQNWSQPSSRPSSTNPAGSYNAPQQIYTNQYFSNNTPASYQTSQASNNAFNPGITASQFAQPQRTNSYQQQSAPYQVAASSTTISPAALQTQIPQPKPNANQSLPTKQGLAPDFVSQSQHTAQTAITRPEPPKGIKQGAFMVIDFKALCDATNSRKVHNFLNISDTLQDLPITKNAIPNYVPRKSRNEIKLLAQTDAKLALKVSKAQPKTKFVTPKTSGVKISSGTTQVLPKSKGSPIELPDSESSAEEDESEYESSSDEEEPPEPSPLPATRPQQLMEATRYDTIKAVWLPRNRYAAPEQIRTGLKAFWEVVKGIRDRWKADVDAHKKAVDFKQVDDIPVFEERVKQTRDRLEVAIRATLDHGHNDIIRLFAENKPQMFAFYQFLHAALRAEDYESTFVRVTLQLLTKCSTLSEEVLEATSLKKAVDRYAKRGTDAIKALAQKILSSSRQKKSLPSSNPAPKTVVDSSKSVESAVKPMAEKASALRKISSTSSAPSTVAVKKSVTTAPSANGTKTTATVSKATSTAGKPAAAASAPLKTKAVVNKAPTNFFASLNVPKRTPAAIAAAKQKAAAAASTDKPVAAAAAPAFSFAQTMASLEKSKNRVEEPPKRATEKDLPPESAEERAKRLRKEERRKLRVTFKPDSQLCQIKEFHHDPEEEAGHDANMVRDVNDINSEGRMFKQHKEMDMDMDDEDDEPMEKTFFDYGRPRSIDFSVVDKDTSDRGFEKTGGTQKAESPEKKLHDQHVANTMMVHYFTRSDIPDCPREPLNPYEGELQPFKMGGQPPEDSPYSRRARQFNPQAAPQVPVQAAAPVDITALLSGLGAQPVVAPPANQPAAIDPLASIMSTLAQFTQTNQQPSQPQAQSQWPVPPPAAVAPPAASSVESILANLQSGAAPSQPSSQPVPVPQTAEQMIAAQWAAYYANPALSQPAAASNAPAPDASAFLAMLGNNQNTTPAAPNMYQNYGSYEQQQSNGMDYGDDQGYGSRKRGRENDDFDNRNRKFVKAGNKQKDWDAPENNKPRYVVQCKFYKEGKCRKGDACTFRHDD